MKADCHPIALIGVGIFIVTFVLMTGTVSWFDWWKLEGCLRFAIVTMQIMGGMAIVSGLLLRRTRAKANEDEPAQVDAGDG